MFIGGSGWEASEADAIRTVVHEWSANADAILPMICEFSLGRPTNSFTSILGLSNLSNLLLPCSRFVTMIPLALDHGTLV